MRQSVATDAVKLTASKMLTMMISMITAMLLSRFRSLEEYGTYSQLLLVVNIMTTIFMLGLPNSINFFLARAVDEKEKQKFLSVYYTLSTTLSLITGLMLILSVPVIVDYFDNIFIKNFMYILAILPWAKIILSSIENVLIVYKRTSLLVWFRVTNSVSLLLIVIIVELLNLSFSAYMILFIIVEALFAIYVYLIVVKISGALCFNFDVSVIKKILIFSVPLGLASVIGILSVELDKLLIGKFYTTKEVAIYTNAAREMPVAIIASSLTAVLMPKLVRLLKEKKNNDAVFLWGEAITISYIIICFFSIALIVYSPEVITLLYSEKYLPGVDVFRVYCLVLLLRFTYFGMILNSIGKTRLIFYSSIGSLVLNIILSIIFYFTFGFLGPAIATFFSILLVALFQIIYTARSVMISFKKIFPWKDLYIITLINITFGLIFSCVKWLLPIEIYVGEIIESIITGLIWAIIYMVFIYKKLRNKWNSLNNS